MGLLTNPKTRERAVQLISRHNNKLCLLCYVAGVAWFLALAYRPFNAGTYFSENALLPGLVEADFYHDHGAADYHRALKEELKAIKDATEKSPEKELMYRIPSAWIESQFLALGLDTYVQNFTFIYPSSILKGQVFHGQNVYGILRAPKAASTEALVLSVPYRPPESDLDKTAPGLALILALAKAFRKHTYWAKDLIFLVTEQESAGMQAWLGAYHNSPSQYIEPAELHGRSGSIQAAINLEIGLETNSRLNIKLEGVNGQLPNLDLVNTVVRLCKREGIMPAIHKKIDTHNPESMAGFEHNLRTMMMMMWHQAPGSPTGNHGLFHRYNIEAITIQSIKTKNARRMFSYAEMGRVIEGVFRSLNNLLERFHQSFFFYLLPATDRYVSIGLYMPPFGVMAAPILIKALALWISYCFKSSAEESDKSEDKDKEGEETTEESKDESKETKETKTKSKSKAKAEEKADTEEADETEESKGESEDAAEKPDKKIVEARRKRGLMSIVPVVIMAFFFGLLGYNGPSYSIESSNPFHIPPGDGLGWGTIALMFSSMLFPRILKNKSTAKGEMLGADPTLLKCFALLLVGLLLGATSVMNISLAFFLALTWTPALLVVWPRKSRLATYTQYIILNLISPFGMLYICCAAKTILGGKVADPLDLHFRTWEEAKHVLLLGVIDGAMIGNWTFNLILLAYFPAWLLLWALLWTEE